MLGAAIIAGNAVALPPFISVSAPVYFHLFMLGWVTQIIFGVAWWMFPRLDNNNKGNELPGWVLYGLLNTGLISRAVSEPLNSLSPGTVWAYLLVVSAVLQLAAGGLYVWLLWPRVRGKKIKSFNLKENR